MPSPQVLLRQSRRYQLGLGGGIGRSLEEAQGIAQPLLNPKAVWAVEPLDPASRELPQGLPDDLYARLTLHFGVVCTIGEALEERSRDAFRREHYTLGYLLDKIGTFAVSLLAQQAANLLCKEHGAVRWAPGDRADDQSFQTQRDLFNWVPAEEIGVRLTRQRVMVPVKSLSYHLYAGPELHGVECLIACSHCVWDGACDKQREVARPERG